MSTEPKTRPAATTPRPAGPRPMPQPSGPMMVPIERFDQRERSLIAQSQEAEQEAALVRRLSEALSEKAKMQAEIAGLSLRFRELAAHAESLENQLASIEARHPGITSEAAEKTPDGEPSAEGSSK